MRTGRTRMTEQQPGWIKRLVEPLRVKPGSTVHLPRDFDPGARFGVRKKGDGQDLLRQGKELLAEYQDRLSAQDTFAVLVVLQAMDAAGKDGTIRHVMSGVNPQGVDVTSFKQPSAEELGHDFLWRAARALPARGRIAIFNRSHYEDVIAVRVHPEWLERQHLAGGPPGAAFWQQRYESINDFERHIERNGTKIVKLFLHV